MARNIHSNFYEDNYVKYECQNCKRKFIVGERLSQRKAITCPYCQSSEIESTAMADETNTEEMEMGCVGIYFHTYPDGELMLYTEKEFVQAMNEAFFDKGIKSVSLGGHYEILREFCEKRNKAGKYMNGTDISSKSGITNHLASLGYSKIIITNNPGIANVKIHSGRIASFSTQEIEYIKTNKPITTQINVVRKIFGFIRLWMKNI